MPPAARIADFHLCPSVDLPPPKPRKGGPIITGFPTVIIGYQFAARVEDRLVCPSGNVSTIETGSPTVYIGNQMASRVGDICERSGVIVYGCPTVNIGTTPQIQTLLAAAELGIPFCEECGQGELAEPTEGP